MLLRISARNSSFLLSKIEFICGQTRFGQIKRPSWGGEKKNKGGKQTEIGNRPKKEGKFSVKGGISAGREKTSLLAREYRGGRERMSSRN